MRSCTKSFVLVKQNHREMNAAFAQPLFLNRGPPLKYATSNISPCRTSRPIRTARLLFCSLQGWAETRLDLPNLEDANSSLQQANLPGVHFVHPPKVTTDDLLQLVRGESPDTWVNELLLSFLGWRKLHDGQWSDDAVQEEWKESYPDGPPDFIGKPDDYSPATDRPVKKAVQKLTRSIPSEYKNLLKEVLKPKGFPGWTVKELTPNRTRRSTAANWILYWYRVHYPDYEWP